MAPTGFIGKRKTDIRSEDHKRNRRNVNLEIASKQDIRKKDTQSVFVRAYLDHVTKLRFN